MRIRCDPVAATFGLESVTHLSAVRKQSKPQALSISLMELPDKLPPLTAFKRAALADHGFLLADVAPTEPEYAAVLKALGLPTTGHPSYPTIVERVYNPYLEKAFAARIVDIEKRRGISPSLLFPMFHGTTEMALNAIMREGFDPTKNRVSAYGRGTYFARDYALSSEYSRTDQYGYKIMFACKVIKGASEMGAADKICDTTKWDSFANSCDSIVVSPYRDGAVPLYVVRWYGFVPGTQDQSRYFARKN